MRIRRHLVQARPVVGQTRLLQQWHATDGSRQMPLLPVEVHGLVEALRLGRVRLAGENARAFSVEVQTCREVDDERKLGWNSR